MRNPHSYDVLVVGAGPAGLTTAISAARHGARVLVVERRPSTSTLPRATHVSTRSMEILRGWGLADAVRDRAVRVLPATTTARTMADPDPAVSPVGLPPLAEMLRRSPTWPALTPQDQLEPLLAAHLREVGGEIVFDTELTGVAATDQGVRAVLGSGREVDALFLVGADGPRSVVRRRLGIEVEELGVLGEYVLALVRADLGAALGPSWRYVLHVVEHPRAEGVVAPAGEGRFLYAQQWHPERGERPSDWTPRRVAARFRLATGVPTLQVEVLRVRPFTMAGHIAAAFRAGTGFLVGDAAHRMTPYGGMGMNTAIQDGHNLGWKLAWVCRGWAGEALLDSYQPERRPVGLRNALISVQRIEPSADRMAEELGVAYRSPVLPDAAGGAGRRAPHAWVELHGRRLSTLDLFDGRLTVLAGRHDRSWCSAAARLAATGLPIGVHTVGGDLRDPVGELAERYALRPDEAVLVRPDGYLAWRGASATALPSAVDTALGRRRSRSWLRTAS